MKYGEDEPSPLNSNDIINTDKTTVNSENCRGYIYFCDPNDLEDHEVTSRVTGRRWRQSTCLLMKDLFSALRLQSKLRFFILRKKFCITNFPVD